jgi:hypothetical protein
MHQLHRRRAKWQRPAAERRDPAQTTWLGATHVANMVQNTTRVQPSPTRQHGATSILHATAGTACEL